MDTPVLPGSFDGVVAITAVDRSALPGLERYLSDFVALRAGSRKQLALSTESRLNASEVTTAQLAGFSGLAAGWTAFRGISIPLGLIIGLLFDTKYKGSAAIKTSHGFFLQSH